MNKQRFQMKKGVGPHKIKIEGNWEMLTSGDTLFIEPASLGKAIDKFEQLDSDDSVVEVESKLIVVKRKSGGYDVVNEITGKPINEVPMSKADAYATAEIPEPIEEKKAKTKT